MSGVEIAITDIHGCIHKFNTQEIKAFRFLDTDFGDGNSIVAPKIQSILELRETSPVGLSLHGTVQLLEIVNSLGSRQLDIHVTLDHEGIINLIYHSMIEVSTTTEICSGAMDHELLYLLMRKYKVGLDKVDTVVMLHKIRRLIIADMFTASELLKILGIIFNV